MTKPTGQERDPMPVEGTPAPEEAATVADRSAQIDAPTTPPTAAAGADTTPEERVAQLERELAEERERATDYMQRWQRAQADFSNFRRRAQQEQEQVGALAAAQSLALILPALDSLERAFKTLPATMYQFAWIDGVALVELQLRRALEAQGVQPFEPQPGEALDPNRHQAIAHAETAEHPDGAIVEVVQRGYTLQGRTLRPALVSVARAAGASEPGTGAAAASDSGPPGDGGPAPAEPSASGP